MRFFLLTCLLLPSVVSAQHDHGTSNDASHLSHILSCRQQTVYIHNLPEPALMDGIGESRLTIQTSSETTQQYFSQGVALLHCFWDFEAYRSFKEAIRHDSSALMPYWGLLETIGSFQNEAYEKDKGIAVRKIKELKGEANDHERLYAEGVLLRDSLPGDGYREYAGKLELIVHKYPEDVDAKLFLALNKMSGFDAEMNPREGHLYSEYLLRDILHDNPDNAAAHHYWIHQMENCCPEQALESAGKLAGLAPRSGHIVHMPGHIWYKLGDYKKAYDTFVASMKVDSTYMAQYGIHEVDNWNFIHNINYLLANCAEDGRYSTGLYYAGKLKNMVITRERKKTYDKIFFYQGILAPAKMEMRFAFWERAVKELEAIADVDSIFGKSAMAYKEALTIFSQGMAAVQAKKLDAANRYARELDAFLWRNNHQAADEEKVGWRSDQLNIASLQLQGCLKSAEGHYREGLELLEKAHKKEKALGYSEPPAYPTPVLLSIASTHQSAGEYDQAIIAYEEHLARRPNNANALFGLAAVYRKKGDLAQAKEFEEKFFDVTQYGDPDVFKNQIAR